MMGLQSAGFGKGSLDFEGIENKKVCCSYLFDHTIFIVSF